MTSACQPFEPDLSAYLDGELPTERHAEVGVHVSSCKRCATELTQLEGVSSLLRRWDAVETRYASSHAFRNRVIDRVGAQRGGRARSLPNPWWGRSAAAAALLGAVGMGWAMAQRQAPSHGNVHQALDAEIERLRAELATAGEPAPAVATHDPASPDWVPVVSAQPVRSVADEPEVVEEPQRPSFEWEQRGDLLVVRNAVDEADRFENERRWLSVEETLREARKPTPREAGTSAPAPLPPLARFFANAEVATERLEAYKHVQVWPIRIPAAAAADGRAPLIAKEAIKNRVLRVSESDVPGLEGHVLLVNRDPSEPVLVLAGDVFRGGKQDRVAAQDVLIPPGLSMHVKMKTSGRRRSRTSYRNFTDSPGMAPTGLRAMLAANVGQRAFDKGVRNAVTALGTPIRQGSLDNLYGSNQLSNQVAAYAKHFTPRLGDKDVIGFAVAAGSEVLGIEVFGDRATFEALQDRLLKSYVLEALTRDRLSDEIPVRAEIQGALAAAAQGTLGHETVSGIARLGDIVDRADPVHGLFGYGLLLPEGVVHASVFPHRPTTSASPDSAGRRGRGPLGDGSRPTGGVDTPDTGDLRGDIGGSTLDDARDR